MTIRKATYHDAPAIKMMLEALGYTTRTSLLVDQLETLCRSDDFQVLVYELRKEVVGFIAVNYLRQLGFENEWMLISFLAVDEGFRGSGIGMALENYVVELAKQRKCERVEVHWQEGRTEAHQFYLQQGYQENPKYFTKRLV